MKMREYVDSIQGEGSWDRMHDLIDAKNILGWDMPMLDVDGYLVDIFPGEDREATVEQVKDAVRRVLKQIKDGES